VAPLFTSSFAKTALLYWAAKCSGVRPRMGSVAFKFTSSMHQRRMKRERKEEVQFKKRAQRGIHLKHFMVCNRNSEEQRSKAKWLFKVGRKRPC